MYLGGCLLKRSANRFHYHLFGHVRSDNGMTFCAGESDPWPRKGCDRTHALDTGNPFLVEIY